MLYREQIDKNRIPAHIAIIMDGNGRWAKQQGKVRSFGHQAGAETVHVIAEEAARLGVKYLTLYTFSTENWNRPVDEVAALMSLLMDQIEEETFMKNNIRFRIIGDVDRLPANVLARLNDCIAHTAANTGMTLVLALSYSARWEITDAVKQIARRVQQGQLKPEDVTDEVVAQHLTTAFMPDPDLSSARAARCASATTCCGKAPTPSCTSATPTGRTSARRRCVKRYMITNRENADSAKPVNNFK
jgi:undecaprenyl diphosphate synthase